MGQAAGPRPDRRALAADRGPAGGTGRSSDCSQARGAHHLVDGPGADGRDSCGGRLANQRGRRPAGGLGRARPIGPTRCARWRSKPSTNWTIPAIDGRFARSDPARLESRTEALGLLAKVDPGRGDRAACKTDSRMARSSSGKVRSRSWRHCPETRPGGCFRAGSTGWSPERPRLKSSSIWSRPLAKRPEPEFRDRIKKYESTKPKDDPLAAYREVLAGGDLERGPNDLQFPGRTSSAFAATKSKAQAANRPAAKWAQSFPASVPA